MNKYQLQQYFNACKDSIEKQFQAELDKEDEPQILQAYDDPDDYRDNEEDR